MKVFPGRLAVAIAFLLSVSTLVPTALAESSSDLLGVVDFPTSGSAEAQPHFIEGLLYLHNFEYRDAVAAFKRAQEIDPDFAMAYWGEAMTYNHPLWAEQARQTARDALNRLARTPEARQAKAGTQREKDYLWALEVLYGNVGGAQKLPKEDRDELYREAMRRLHEKYPEDHDAAAFYGLSILGAAREGRDFATYMKAAAVLTGVWDVNRKHPGAAHYLIHSYDDPVHAPLGLPMARAYSEIAPGAAHAQHMVSHIFVALGMWDDMVVANERAIAAQSTPRRTEDGRALVLGHYPFWLEYGYLQQGRHGEARRMMEAAYERMQHDPIENERTHYGFMLARYVVDTEDWLAAERWATEFSSGAKGAADYYFAQTYAAAVLGELDKARELLDTLRQCTAMTNRPDRRDIPMVMEKQILGLVAVKEGNEDEGFALLRDAAALEEAMPMIFGPPAVPKPAYELLGELLLESGRTDEAENAFEKQLARTPRRTASLLGSARVARAQGDNEKAVEYFRELAAVWHDAEPDVLAHGDLRRSFGTGSD